MLQAFQVWSAGPADTWAILFTDEIWHHDGSAWTLQLKAPVLAVSLQGLHGASPTDIWAVAQDNGILLHYNGSGWTNTSVPALSALYDVWAVDAGNVWVVGESGTIFHYDGHQWSPSPSGVSNTLAAVLGYSGDEVWAAGVGIILRFNGKQWFQETIAP